MQGNKHAQLNNKVQQHM